MTATAQVPARTMFAVEDVTKSFAGIPALSDISLDVRPGEVLALMGENGAGKSTLLKILSGDYQPDSGRLLLDGSRITFPSPADARRAGVRVIYQEPEIIPHVSVAENVLVGSLPHKARVLDRQAMNQRLQSDLERYGFAGVLRPQTMGSRLTAAQRQLVEIMRAITADVRVIAFDEPTSSLSDQEVDALFDLIGRLRDSDVAVIYVSHRLKEIFRVADRVAVLRDGRLVGIRDVTATDENELVRMMVGRDLSSMFRRQHTGASAGNAVLSLHEITTDDVADVSFDVRAGEVVGLAGLVGAGRSELVRAVVGDLPIRTGQVRVDGKRLRLRSPQDAKRAGIGFAPEERKSDALILQRSVRDNTSLAVLDQLRRWRVIRVAKERTMVQGYVKQLNIRTPSIEQEVRKLSGGNQQKVVLARWLARRPKVLILDEPTRGVDVGAKAEIYSIIDQLASEGVAILVISSELPEVLGLSDRVLVMQDGRITGELTRHEATEERVLSLAMPDHAPQENQR